MKQVIQHGMSFRGFFIKFCGHEIWPYALGSVCYSGDFSYVIYKGRCESIMTEFQCRKGGSGDAIAHNYAYIQINEKGQRWI